MKVIAAQSFFDSLKNLNSWKNKWYSFKSWIYFHTRKDFLKIIKVAFKGYPWQDSFLYELERVKLQEMIEYHIRNKRFEGWEYVVRDMQICVNLIDIILEEKELFTYEGEGFKYTPIEGTDTYEVTCNDEYILKIYMNTRNAYRFVPRGKDNPYFDYWCSHPDEIYKIKAKYLYHKIRYERDAEWWD